MTVQTDDHWVRELNEDPDIPFEITVASGSDGPFEIALFASFEDDRKGFEYSKAFDVDSPVKAVRLMLESIREDGFYSLDNIEELSVLPVIKVGCDECHITTMVPNTEDSSPLAILRDRGWYAESLSETDVQKCSVHNPINHS